MTTKMNVFYFLLPFFWITVIHGCEKYCRLEYTKADMEKLKDKFEWCDKVIVFTIYVKEEKFLQEAVETLKPYRNASTIFATIPADFPSSTYENPSFVKMLQSIGGVYVDLGIDRVVGQSKVFVKFFKQQAPQLKVLFDMDYNDQFYDHELLANGDVFFMNKYMSSIKPSSVLKPKLGLTLAYDEDFDSNTGLTAYINGFQKFLITSPLTVSNHGWLKRMTLEEKEVAFDKTFLCFSGSDNTKVLTPEICRISTSEIYDYCLTKN